MSALNLLIRGENVVTPAGVGPAVVGIADGRIAFVETESDAEAVTTIDAGRSWVLPGFIDAHVHFNEPGRADWEGLASGSEALALGGGATFFDMPLNASPPTLDAAAFALKRGAAERSAVCDFGLWGGLTPCNLDHLEALRDCGVIGLRAFMSNSGMEDFPRADHRTLREGMRIAAGLGLVVAVHAENEERTAQLARERIAAGRVTIRDYLDSRPIAAETGAIREALDLAGETGCALHIVHVSSASGVRLVAEARAAGADVTAETCPHYLLLNEADALRMGATAKCAPPLRPESERQALWSEVLAGAVDTIGSDHSPAPPEMKRSRSFFEEWGGIAGCQHGFRLVIDAAGALSSPFMPPTAFAGMFAGNVARRFGIAHRKGSIVAGRDADFTVIDPDGLPEAIRPSALRYRHRLSPYCGYPVRARVAAVVRRGEVIVRDGGLTAETRGRLITPERHG